MAESLRILLDHHLKILKLSTFMHEQCPFHLSRISQVNFGVGPFER